MPSTARRRWSRELDTQIDGVAVGSTGPVIVHGYEPPAGDKWMDSVIPGRLCAFERTSGEMLWRVPCEVGYGRGFGAGLLGSERVVVLGPGLVGHKIAHMSISNGELLGAAPIDAFDEALVFPDLCICLSHSRIFAVDTNEMTEAWSYGEGERFHHVERIGDRILAVFSTRGGQGILRLDAETGEYEGRLLSPEQPIIHCIAGGDDLLVALTSDLRRVLAETSSEQLEAVLAEHPGGGLSDTLSLLALRADSEPGDEPCWFRVLETEELDELPEASILVDSGKLYVERGTLLEALDALTGRPLGEWTVPGLDERLDWRVVDGAGLLAEETRLSIFELPA